MKILLDLIRASDPRFDRSDTEEMEGRKALGDQGFFGPVAARWG